MEEIFDKIFNLYTKLNADLTIGYTIDQVTLNKIIDLINIIDFITWGNPTNDELLWIADHFETINYF